MSGFDDGFSVTDFNDDTHMEPFVILKRKRVDYSDSPSVEPIFQRFISAPKMESYRVMSAKTGIPFTTIRNWHKKFKTDPSWRPGKTNISHNRRVFNDTQEAEITRQLDDEFISQQRSLTFDMVRKVITSYGLEQIDPHEDGTVSGPSKVIEFKCSRHYMDDFIDRNHLSNRVCTAERRPTIDPIEVNTFKQLLQEALDDVSDKVIINADESQWRVLMPPRRSIARKGQDSVKLNINGDKKAGFTIIGTISSDGDKYPLVMIAKGSTWRCHKQLGEHPKFKHKVFHSKSGWVTEEVFIEYLNWIRSIERAKKIYLVIDQFGPHIGPSSEATARRLNIAFIPVPKGGTGEFQPLDRGIYGIMKKKGSAKWTRIAHRNPDKKWDKETAAGIALECWGAITEEHIHAAWDLRNEVLSCGSTESTSDDDFKPEIRNE